MLVHGNICWSYGAYVSALNCMSAQFSLLGTRNISLYSGTWHCGIYGGTLQLTVVLNIAVKSMVVLVVFTMEPLALAEIADLLIMA